MTDESLTSASRRSLKAWQEREWSSRNLGYPSCFSVKRAGKAKTGITMARLGVGVLPTSGAGSGKRINGTGGISPV